MAWSLFQRRTVTGVEARAGFLDRPVLAVLAISLGLAVIVLGVMVIRIL